MNITFKTPEDETKTHTHVCVWVDSGAMQGYEYLTLDRAKALVLSLHQLIYNAEEKQPETPETEE
jgi:hypothetical protein